MSSHCLPMIFDAWVSKSDRIELEAVAMPERAIA